MSAPSTHVRITPDALTAHHARMRALAVLMVLTTTIAAVVGPWLSPFLGIFGALAIVAWIVAVPMWRRAPRTRGEARIVTIDGQTVSEAIEGRAPHVVAQPIVGARAFDSHLELVVGTLTPKISLAEVHVPWTRAERSALIATLTRVHGIAVIERGSFGRLLLWAFTVVPAATLALVAAIKTVELVLVVGAIAALSLLEPAQLALAVVLLALGGLAWAAMRLLRRAAPSR